MHQMCSEIGGVNQAQHTQAWNVKLALNSTHQIAIALPCARCFALPTCLCQNPFVGETPTEFSLDQTQCAQYNIGVHPQQLRNPSTSIKLGSNVAMLPWPLILLLASHHSLGVGNLNPEPTQVDQAICPHTPGEHNQEAEPYATNIQNGQICMQSCHCNLCISKNLIWQTELQRCLPCACGKAILAQVARVAHHVVLHGAQVALMVMLGPATDALVMQLWLALVRFAGQELLEHFLEAPVRDAVVTDPV